MFLQNWIDKDEQYIRKRWLGFSIACAAFPILISAMFANYYLSFGIPYHVTIFIMLYYLAYRKSGTQLLIFIMSLKLLSFLMIPEMSYAFLSSDFNPSSPSCSMKTGSKFNVFDTTG